MSPRETEEKYAEGSGGDYRLKGGGGGGGWSPIKEAGGHLGPANPPHSRLLKLAGERGRRTGQTASCLVAWLRSRLHPSVFPPPGFFLSGSASRCSRARLSQSGLERRGMHLANFHTGSGDPASRGGEERRRGG